MNSDAISASVEPRTFLVASKDGFDIEVQATQIGPLLVHESVCHEGWSVTELSTGREVLAGFREQTAKALAKKLAALWPVPGGPFNRDWLERTILGVLDTHGTTRYIEWRGRFLGILGMRELP